MILEFSAFLSDLYVYTNPTQQNESMARYDDRVSRLVVFYDILDPLIGCIRMVLLIIRQDRRSPICLRLHLNSNFLGLPAGLDDRAENVIVWLLGTLESCLAVEPRRTAMAMREDPVLMRLLFVQFGKPALVEHMTRLVDAFFATQPAPVIDMSKNGSRRRRRVVPNSLA